MKLAKRDKVAVIPVGELMAMRMAMVEAVSVINEKGNHDAFGAATIMCQVCSALIKKHIKQAK